jgi:hypothetical protein
VAVVLLTVEAKRVPWGISIPTFQAVMGGHDTDRKICSLAASHFTNSQIANNELRHLPILKALQI